MTKIDKHHTFKMYSIYLKDAAIADEFGHHDKADRCYWQAARFAKRLGLKAPDHVLERAMKAPCPFDKPNKPEEGKQYLLIGGSDKPSIANGNTWAESEIGAK